MTNSSDILNLRYDESLNSVIMVWQGFPAGEEFRLANEEVLSLIRETKSNKLIGDLRQMKIISSTNQQWLYEDWLPRTINEGLKYVALVQSEDFFNRKSVDNVVQLLDDKLIIRYFDIVVSARAWMRSLAGD